MIDHEFYCNVISKNYICLLYHILNVYLGVKLILKRRLATVFQDYLLCLNYLSALYITLGMGNNVPARGPADFFLFLIGHVAHHCAECI